MLVRSCGCPLVKQATEFGDLCKWQHQRGPLPLTLHPNESSAHKTNNSGNCSGICWKRKRGNSLYPFSFLSVSIFPFPPSCRSKNINHLPADKISCSVAKQLSHLVESCDEVQSKFLPLSNASGLIKSIGNILPKLTRMQLKRYGQQRNKNKAMMLLVLNPLQVPTAV